MKCVEYERYWGKWTLPNSSRPGRGALPVHETTGSYPNSRRRSPTSGRRLSLSHARGRRPPGPNYMGRWGMETMFGEDTVVYCYTAKMAEMAAAVKSFSYRYCTAKLMERNFSDNVEHSVTISRVGRDTACYRMIPAANRKYLLSHCSPLYSLLPPAPGSPSHSPTTAYR